MKKTDKRWIKNPVDRVAVANGCWFDEGAGKRVVDFFRTFLRHSIGRWAGEPFELLPWQRDEVVMPLFSWRNPDGTRRFRMAYIEIPKKNGKSTLCAGLALYLLMADGEAAAQVYGAAADRAQAGIVYREAKNMVAKSSGLSKYLRVIDSKKEIHFPKSQSFYRVLSSEAPLAEGLNISGLIFDELHAQPDRQLWDALRWGGASRTQPLLISITTAGWDQTSICYEQHDYARKVLDGVIEDVTFFPFIRAAGIDDDWTAPATWCKANPSLGVTINEKDFSADCMEARESPTKENAFKRYRLNIWTEQADRWIRMEAWDACDRPVPDLDGRQCFGGLDLASNIDLAAFVLVFPWEDGSFVWFPRFYIPKENAAQRERRDRVPYLTWAKQGHVFLTPGNVIDYEFIRRDIKALSEKYNIREIAFDRWNACQVVTELLDDGMDMVQFGQGYASMSAPSKLFEAGVIGGQIVHGGHPVLRWNVSNLAAETDAAGNVKPSKKKSVEKIDGVVAGIMALGRIQASGDPFGSAEIRVL